LQTIEHGYANFYYDFRDAFFLLFRRAFADSSSCGKWRWEGKIQIDPEINVVENIGIKQNDLRKAITVVSLYKSEIISMWNEYFSE